MSAEIFWSLVALVESVLLEPVTFTLVIVTWISILASIVTSIL